jgi:hypothetical protein
MRAVHESQPSMTRRSACRSGWQRIAALAVVVAVTPMARRRRVPAHGPAQHDSEEAYQEVMAKYNEAIAKTP